MNENIGALFLEARQAKRMSIDDAAEVVRIKMEYIQDIENGTFNSNLPDIYRRGFYRSYAEFLGLNLEEMMARCPIKPFETLESSQKRREMVSQVAKKTQEVNHDDIKVTFSDDFDDSTVPPKQKEDPIGKVVILKISGIVFVSAVLLFSILYGIISNLGGEDKKTLQDDISKLVQKKIIMRSNNNVKIMVRTEKNKSKIFSGTLSKGEEKTIIYREPIQIYFDQGEALDVEMENGKHLHPDSGRGGLQIK